jgi:hypothetical protein
MSSETKTKNLYQKLLSITEEIGKIDKTGKNTMQGYSFIEQAKVVAEVRVQLAKHGVMIIPEIAERSLERYNVTRSNGKAGTDIHVQVKSRYTLVNADNPDERMICEWDAGEAIDSGDKATNKAVTASDKSFKMKLFNISDQDDPDAHSPAAAAKEVSYTKSPEEPSRSVNDVPLSALTKDVLKEAIQKSNRFKSVTEVKGFYYDTIGKEAPTTEADAEKLIRKLEEPF